MFVTKSIYWLFLLLLLTGCVDKSRDLTSPLSVNNQVEDNFDRGALMVNLVDNIIVPNYKASRDLAAEFSSDTGVLAEYCSDIGDVDEQQKLNLAQTAWRDLMDVVQKTELHIIGPAQRNESALQHRVTSYVSGYLATCGLDQAVIQNEQNSDFSVTNRALNQRGMGAIEYLLFNDDLSHSCSSQVLTTKTWNEMSESLRRVQRCDLALELAKDVATASHSIYQQWTEGDSAYREEFLNEASRGDNFQLITDALFYIETYTKSSKLAIPLGLDPKCSGITCPNLVESPYSKTSLRNIKINTEEFLRVFNGDEGIGFDDLIVEAGFLPTSNRFKNQSAQVISRLASTTTSLIDQVSSIATSDDETNCTNSMANPEDTSSLDACSITGLLKRITDDLKIDFVTIVNVPVPGRVQSDND
jgi:membrane-bound inhibitor of C-type lysozyme